MSGRMRFIHPGVCENEVLALECSLHARIAFRDLPMFADRNGVLEDRWKKIKGQLFRFEPHVNLPSILDELTRKGFLLRYSVAGKKYIFILNFAKYQRPHYKELSSGFPLPPKALLNSVHKSSMTRLSGKENAPCPSDTDTDTNTDTDTTRNESPPLAAHAPSGNGTKPDKEPESQEQRFLRYAHEQSPADIERRLDPHKHFDVFWKLYPRRTGKKYALQAWKRLTVAQQYAAMEALGRHTKYWADTRRLKDKIPHGATWLNGHLWEDEIPTGHVGSDKSIEDELAEIDAINAERKRREAELLK